MVRSSIKDRVCGMKKTPKRKDGTFSTTDLNTKQIQELFENINYATGTKFGISLQWPDRHNRGKC